MGIALAVFLVAIPAGFLLLARRQPSAAAIRRLLATVLADLGTADRAAIAGRVRRRRIFSTVGAIAGLWLTAAWRNGTWTWNGLLSPLHYGQPVGLASGWISLSGGSFLLLVNIWGVLAGFAVGLTVAEWRSGSLGFAEHRSARLEPRETGRYLALWAAPATMLALAGAVCALVIAAVIPDSAKSGSATGETAGASLSWWWASVLIGAGLLALGTRTAVLSSSPHAATLEELTAREATRALTAATLTIVALAAFVASTATTVGRISTWFGWGWGDGTVTAAIALSFLAIGLAISSFLTPYWAIGLRLGSDAGSDSEAVVPA